MTSHLVETWQKFQLKRLHLNFQEHQILNSSLKMNSQTENHVFHLWLYRNSCSCTKPNIWSSILKFRQTYQFAAALQWENIRCNILDISDIYYIFSNFRFDDARLVLNVIFICKWRYFLELYVVLVVKDLTLDQKVMAVSFG